MNQPVHCQKGPPIIRHYREADSQSYTVNQVVILSSNKVAIACASGADLDSGGARILGVVKRAGRNTTNPGQDSATRQNRDVPVEIVGDDSYLCLPIWYSASPSSTNGQYSQYNEGFQCVLHNVGGIFVANVSNTSNPNLQLVAKFPDIDDDELFGMALWKVIAGEREEN